MNIVIDEAIVKAYEQTLKEVITAYESVVNDLKAAKAETVGNQLMTPKETAEYLGVSLQMLDYYKKYDLPYYRTCTRGIWYKRGEVDAWIQSGRVNRHK